MTKTVHLTRPEAFTFLIEGVGGDCLVTFKLEDHFALRYETLIDGNKRCFLFSGVKPRLFQKFCNV